MKIRKRDIIVIAAMSGVLTGCVSNPPKTEVLSSKFTKDFHLPAMPVDKHYIGTPWSKKFGGAIKNREPGDIRVSHERSTNSIHAELSNGISASLGLKYMGGGNNLASAKFTDGGLNKAEGLTVITPRSPADIEYRPDIIYVSEALRLKNYKLTAEKERSLGLSASLPGSGVSAGIGGGGRGRSGEAGQGLVVAYKLRQLTPGSLIEREYQKKLPVEGTTHLKSSLGSFDPVRIKARLKTITDPKRENFKNYTSNGLVWACDMEFEDLENLQSAMLFSIETLTDMGQTIRNTYAVPMNSSKKCDGFGAMDLHGRCSFEKCSFPHVTKLDSGEDPATGKLYQRYLKLHIDDSLHDAATNKVVFNGVAKLKTRMFDVEVVKNPDIDSEIQNAKQRMSRASSQQ